MPFQIECPSSTAEITGHRKLEITGHRKLQANCLDKAVTVVGVQRFWTLGQQLPIKRTEKAAR